MRALFKAIHRLDESLEAQFIAWIEGDHMPGEVQITEQGRSKVRFAGAR